MGRSYVRDGEFDGIELQLALHAKGWRYGCWTVKNPQLYEEGRQFSFDDLCLKVDGRIFIPQVWFTTEGYGQVMVIAM